MVHQTKQEHIETLHDLQITLCYLKLGRIYLKKSYALYAISVQHAFEMLVGSTQCRFKVQYKRDYLPLYPSF